MIDELSKNGIQLEPLTEVLRASVSFVYVDNGFIAQDTNCFLGMETGLSLALTVSNVNAVYFISERSTKDGLFDQLPALLSNLTANSVGMYFASPVGYWWFITDVDGYAKLCERHGLTPNNFKMFPKPDN